MRARPYSCTNASIASKLGCTSETLRRWVRQAERDTGQRAGLTTDERPRLKELEREVRELRRANEILRKASAYFAEDVDGAVALGDRASTARAFLQLAHPLSGRRLL